MQRGPGGVGCSRTNGRFGEESAVEVHEQIVARRFVLVDEEGNPAAPTSRGRRLGSSASRSRGLGRRSRSCR